MFTRSTSRVLGFDAMLSWITLLRTSLALLVLLSTPWNRNCVTATASKSFLLDDNRWTLEPREAKIIQSVADLTDGVYAFELSVTRPGCLAIGGGKQGMYYFFLYIKYTVGVNR